MMMMMMIIMMAMTVMMNNFICGITLFTIIKNALPMSRLHRKLYIYKKKKL